MINEQQRSIEKVGDSSNQRSPEISNSAVTFPTKASSTEKVSTKPPAKFVYNKETMLQIYLEPASKIRPSYLSEEFDECATNESGASAKLWKPDLWIQSLWNREKQTSNSNNNNNNANVSSCNSSSSNQNNTSYRSSTRYINNSRVVNSSTENAGTLNKRVDRLKTENRDVIVLSPQRRSFVGGCQAPSSSANNSSSSGGGGSGTTCSAHVISSVGSSGVNKTQIRDMRSCSPTGASTGHARYSSGGSSDTGCVVSLSSSQATMPTISSATIYNSRRHPPAPHDTSSTTVRSTSNRGCVGGFGSYSSRVENWRDRSSKNFTDTYNNRSQQRRWAPPSSSGDRSASSSDGYSSYKQSNYSSNKLPEWATEGPADVHDVIELCGFEDDRTSSLKDDDSSEKVRQTVGAETSNSWYDTKSTVTDTVTYQTAIGSQASKETSPNDLAKSTASPNSKFGTAATTATSSSMTETLTDLSNVTFSENCDNIIGNPKGSRFTQFFSKGVGESAAKVAASTVGAAFKTTNCHTAAPLTSLLASAATTTKSSDVSSSLQKSAVPVGAVNLEELEAMLCGKTKPPQMQNAESDATKSEGTPAMKQLLLKDLFKSASISQPSSAQIGFLENQINAATSNMIPTSDGLAIPSHLATARLAKFPPGKTNPLSDPSQQQKLMDALNKLKSEQMTPIEEQQQQQQQQQSSLSAKSGIFAAPANVLAPNQSLPQTAVAAVQPMPAAHLPYLINQQLLAQQAAAAADIIRLVQQQQQQRQQAIRLQQLQLMQQMTSVPRLPVPGKQLTQEEYQQMLALTLFQQQQQAAVQRAAAAAAAGNASAVDILRQRALLAAAALPNAAALQQAQLFNSFRQPNFSQPPPDAPNVRNLLNVGGLSGAVVPNAAATANLNAAAAKSLMEEIERLQKSQQQPPQ